jgi:hypothetical protein
MTTSLKSAALLRAFPLLVSATLISGCYSDQEPTPPPPPEPTCQLPTLRPTQGLDLSQLSYSFDSYYPHAIPSDDVRLALQTRKTTPAGSTTPYAARVWTGTVWQTWELPETASTGGFGLPSFRIASVGGYFTAFAHATVTDSLGVATSGWHVYEENQTHDGFTSPLKINNLATFQVREVGGLDSEGWTTAVGLGTTPSEPTSSIIIIEKSLDETWNASKVRVDGVPISTSIIPEAVGYHPDGTPWIVYSQSISGSTREFRLTRRVGSLWEPGILLGSAKIDDSNRLDSVSFSETGAPTVAFFWTTTDTTHASMVVRKYHLATGVLDGLKTAFTVPLDGCGNCIAGNLAFSSNGTKGYYTIRQNSTGRAWLGKIDNDTFAPPAEFLPEYVVGGTLRPYYNSCGEALVSFNGRPAIDPVSSTDFTVLKIEE